MILRFRAEFTDDWSLATLEGDDEPSASNILTSALVRLDYEVEVLQSGDWLDILEADLGQE